MKLSEITVTSGDFASLFEVSRRTVESWKREGMPHLKRGILLLEGVRWWRAERFKELDALKEARIKKETAKAKIAELDAAERKIIDPQGGGDSMAIDYRIGSETGLPEPSQACWRNISWARWQRDRSNSTF